MLRLKRVKLGATAAVLAAPLIAPLLGITGVTLELLVTAGAALRLGAAIAGAIAFYLNQTSQNQPVPCQPTASGGNPASRGVADRKTQAVI